MSHQLLTYRALPNSRKILPLCLTDFQEEEAAALFMSKKSLVNLRCVKLSYLFLYAVPSEGWWPHLACPHLLLCWTCQARRRPWSCSPSPRWCLYQHQQLWFWPPQIAPAATPAPCTDSFLEKKGQERMLVMDVLISPPTHLQAAQPLLYPFSFDSAPQ